MGRHEPITYSHFIEETRNEQVCFRCKKVIPKGSPARWKYLPGKCKREYIHAEFSCSNYVAEKNGGGHEAA